MSTLSTPVDPSGAADASANSAAPATPAPKPRWFSLRGGNRARQFALSLKANARWMTQFLHGGK